jgi:pyruvate/2-oxoglutarate dehydrogenase complex dihydrolipoamide acyltransferase (E2) component
MRKPIAVAAIMSLLASPALVRGADHVASAGAVRTQLAAAAAERGQNLASVEAALATPEAGRMAARAGVDINKVRATLPQMSDDDLRDLSRRAAVLTADPVAGDELSHDLRLLVFIGLVGALALVLIHAAD